MYNICYLLVSYTCQFHLGHENCVNLICSSSCKQRSLPSVCEEDSFLLWMLSYWTMECLPALFFCFLFSLSNFWLLLNPLSFGGGGMFGAQRALERRPAHPTDGQRIRGCHYTETSQAPGLPLRRGAGRLNGGISTSFYSPLLGICEMICGKFVGSI